MTQRERAEALRALHDAPGLAVLPNVWDAASARTVAAVAGCRALATASWAIAAAHGVPDGGAIGREAMLAAVATIARAVDLPVSADLEDGYGDAGATVRGALAAGAVGCNLEDRGGDPDEHAARIAAARAAGEETGVPLVVNARTDVLLRAALERAVVEDARRRGLAYLAAGADCVFAIGLTDRDAIAELGRAFDGRLSLLVRPGSPPLSELAALGVARVTFGPGLMGVAHAALDRAAAAVLAEGELPADLAFRPPG